MGETPEETPILGGAKKSEPVVTAAPSAEPVAAPVAAAPKKKSHAGLIVTIIILAVLLIGGGVAAFLWMMWHESAEVSINDAMAKSFETTDRTISGSMSINSMGGVKVTFDGSQSDGSVGGSGKISLGAGLVELKFDAAMIKDGDIYIKLDGIKDAIKTLPVGQLFGAFLGMGDMGNSADAEEIVSSVIGAIGEVVDGEWIKITAKDFETLSEGKSECDYGEILDLVNGDAPKELADVYKKNAFIVQKKDSEVKDEDGVKYYEVEIDEEKMANFTKSIKDSDFGKKIAKCSTSTGDSEKEGEETTFKANKDTKIYFGIKPWSHELAAIKLENEKKDGLSAKFEIGYEKKAVEEPSKAKSVDDLKTKIEAAIQEAYTKYLTKYMSSYGSGYGNYGGYSLDDISGYYGL